MKVHLHQDVLGHKADTDQEVDGTHAEWLIANGYASKAGDDSDKHLVTTVDAEDDPTLAVNREEPGELDVVDLEDEAENSEAAKLATADKDKAVRLGGTTEKRDPKSPEYADTEAATYDGASEPTVGRVAEPVSTARPSSTANKDAGASEA